MAQEMKRKKHCDKCIHTIHEATQLNWFGILSHMFDGYATDMVRHAKRFLMPRNIDSE